jgi:hypothetical protein
MFDVTPKFLATLKKTPTSELKAVKERALTTLDDSQKLEMAVDFMSVKTKKTRTEAEVIPMIQTFVGEIDKVLRARGCTL